MNIGGNMKTSLKMLENFIKFQKVNEGQSKHLSRDRTFQSCSVNNPGEKVSKEDGIDRMQL